MGDFNLQNMAERDPSGADPAIPARDHVEAIALGDRCKAEWNQNAELRSQFASLEQYTAYARAAEQGRVRVFGREETYGPRSRRKRPGSAGPNAEELIRRWKASSDVRAEFRDDFSRFAAYEAARARGATPARE